MRLDPRRRYLLDLLARFQTRTMTGVIEAAITEEAKKVNLGGKSLYDRLEELWAGEEAERLARLALFARLELRTEEDAIWEVVLKTPGFWREGSARSSMDDLRLEVLLRHWQALKKHVEEHGSGGPFPLSETPQVTFDEDFPFGNFKGD